MLRLRPGGALRSQTLNPRNEDSDHNFERMQSRVIWLIVLANLAFIGLFVLLAYEKPSLVILYYVLAAAAWLYFLYRVAQSTYGRFIERR
jgi:hypothetical protein